MSIMDSRRHIDINADIGEGWDDASIVPFVNSVNIACGGHTGDETSMLAALELAARYRARAGAHPSWPDRDGFGRRAMEMPREEFLACMDGQINRLARLAQSQGIRLTHVKPHGALYHALYKDMNLARLFARILPKGLTVITMPGGVLASACDEMGIGVWFEGYADRAYTNLAKLASRDIPGALITDPAVAARQAKALASGAAVTTLEGGAIRFSGLHTICVHSDTPGATPIAQSVYTALSQL